MALSFGAFEFFWLALLGVVLSGNVVAADPLKGWLAGLLGLFVAGIGQDGMYAYERFAFGNADLAGGFGLIPVLVGAFGFSEVLTVMSERFARPKIMEFGSALPRIMDVLRYWRTILRSGVIGVWIGILPGVGEDMAAWSSYAAARRLSKEPEKYGKGSIEGLMAAETGDNASVPGGIIPALALAIPGSAPCAVLLAAMIIHGVQPGPMLMVENPQFVYDVVAMVLFSTLGILFFGLFFIRPLLKITQIPRSIMMPLIFVLCVIGSYSLSSRLFDVYTMLGFGTLVFMMRRYGYPAAPFVLGLVLGDILDKNLRRGLVLSDGDILPFFTRPLSALLALLVLWTFITNVRPSTTRCCAGATRCWPGFGRNAAPDDLKTSLAHENRRPVDQSRDRAQAVRPQGRRRGVREARRARHLAMARARAGAGMAEAGRIIRHNGMKVTGYCRGGLFGSADAAGQQALIDDNKRMIDEGAAIGADCLMMIGGGLAPGSRDIKAARGRYLDGMAAILPHARACKVALAVEPLHPMYAADRGCISLLSEALDVCDQLGEGTGVVVDAYHLWWDPNLAQSIARAKGAHPGASHLRLAGADEGHPARSRHDGRRRDRPAGDPPHGRGRGLPRLSGSGDLLGRGLVEAAGRRGDPHLHRALQHGAVSVSYLRRYSAGSARLLPLRSLLPRPIIWLISQPASTDPTAAIATPRLRPSMRAACRPSESVAGLIHWVWRALAAASRTRRSSALRAMARTMIGMTARTTKTPATIRQAAIVP